MKRPYRSTDGGFYCWVTGQGIVLRTSSVISFDRHKKRQEECLSPDLLGHAVVTTTVRRLRGRSRPLPAQRREATQRLRLRAPRTFHCRDLDAACGACAHVSLVRTGHVMPSDCGDRKCAFGAPETGTGNRDRKVASDDRGSPGSICCRDGKTEVQRG